MRKRRRTLASKLFGTVTLKALVGNGEKKKTFAQTMHRHRRMIPRSQGHILNKVSVHLVKTIILACSCVLSPQYIDVKIRKIRKKVVKTLQLS